MGFSLITHGTVPRDEIMGVVIGHVWYFFNDVYPPLHNNSRPLDPPTWWARLFGRQQDQVNQQIIDGIMMDRDREPQAAQG